MDVRDYAAQKEVESKEKMYIFNPLGHDFTWSYDSVPYTIPSKESLNFDKPIALHLAKHLIDAYLADEKLPNEELEARARLLVLPND